MPEYSGLTGRTSRPERFKLEASLTRLKATEGLRLLDLGIGG